jgi:glutathione S-transferase
MLVIWGRTNSINVQKVLWCCEELALSYDRKDAGGKFGIVNTPEYRALNPNGLVPTMDDDGFVVWESNVIVRYLCAKHGKDTLWPQDLRTRAIAEQWMDWHVSTYSPAIRDAFWQLVRTPPEQRDANAIAASARKSAEAMTLLDAHLARHPFVAGDAFSMGDIPMGAGTWRYYQLAIERPSLPNLQRWLERLSERPAFRKVIMQPLT